MIEEHGLEKRFDTQYVEYKKRGVNVHPETKEGRSKKDSMKQFLIKERQ